MLMTTTLMTMEERQRVLAAVPWHDELSRFAGVVSGAINADSANAFDAAFLGPGHVRSAMVALEEGADTLLDATLDLCDSVAVMALFDRTSPRHPFSPDAGISVNPLRLSLRRSRGALESGAVRAVSASDHLANAHLRLAWEMNAATAEEVKRFDFRPAEQEPRSWVSSRFLRDRLSRLPTGADTVLPFFVCNEPFADFVRSDAVGALFAFRNQIVHAERPEYREVPSPSRRTGWSRGRLNLAFIPDSNAPSLEDIREMIGAAITTMLPWARALWETAREWLADFGVQLLHDADAGTVRSSFGIRRQPARDQRDPSRYLLRTAAFATSVR